MNIREFSHNLQKVYHDIDEVFSKFQKQSNLPCLSKCGNCCSNPEIEATPLEMVPLALKILDQGHLDQWYERLLDAEGKSCLMYNGSSCEEYGQRPSLCRMFGVAGYYNKQHEITLSICKLIKEEYPDETAKALTKPFGEVPVISHWTSKLQSLDPKLVESRQPINMALKSALEKVALWSQYNA